MKFIKKCSAFRMLVQFSLNVYPENCSLLSRNTQEPPKDRSVAGHLVPKLLLVQWGQMSGFWFAVFRLGSCSSSVGKYVGHEGEEPAPELTFSLDSSFSSFAHTLG